MKKLILAILSLAILSLAAPCLSACSSIPAATNTSDTGNSVEDNSMDLPEVSPAQLPTGSLPPYSYRFNNADELRNWIVSEDKSDIWVDFITTIQNQGYVATVNGLSGEVSLDSITVWPDLRFIRHSFTNTTNGDRMEVDIQLTDQSLNQFVSEFSAEHQEVAMQFTKASNVQFESSGESALENNDNRSEEASLEVDLYYYNAYSPPGEGYSQIHSVTMAFFELDDTIITVNVSRLSLDTGMNVTWDNDYLELFEFNRHPI